MKVFGFEIRVIWEKINDQRAQKKKSVCRHTFPSPLSIGEFWGRVKIKHLKSQDQLEKKSEPVDLIITPTSFFDRIS